MLLDHNGQTYGSLACYIMFMSVADTGFEKGWGILMWVFLLSEKQILEWVLHFKKAAQREGRAPVTIWKVATQMWW